MKVKPNNLLLSNDVNGRRHKFRRCGP